MRRLLFVLLAALAVALAVPACDPEGADPLDPADAAASVPDDASTQALPDAGSPEPGPDAGEPGLDAGVAPDAGESADASENPDASEGADASAAADAGSPDSGRPPDRWTSVEHLRNFDLKNALNAAIKGHRSIGYDSAKGALFDAPNGIDVHNGKVECVYSGQLFDPSDLDSGGGFNTEHSWPQSEFGAESTTAKGDMHHLFPTEKDLNSCRSSFPFGETDNPDPAPCSVGGSERGPKIGSSATIFEVRPIKRGDIARAHFYFSTRYNLGIGAAEEAVLRAWHAQDPVDDAERVRNDRIEAVQRNRNPFIDRPEFVEYIGNF